MQLGWVDYSREERETIKELLKVLGEYGSLDELGVGIVRDSISDLFYAENDGVSDILQTFNSLINTESEKLQQVAAEIHEKHGIKVDKLWLVVGVIVLVQCTAPLIEYVLVENGLKRKFDENGNIRK